MLPDRTAISELVLGAAPELSNLTRRTVDIHGSRPWRVQRRMNILLLY